MKIAVRLSLFLLLVLVGLFFWLYASLDSIVKNGIEKYGSQITQASVRLQQVKLQPQTGQGELQGLFIGNPAGFRSAHLLRVDSIDLQLDPASVGGDVVLIQSLSIVAPDIHFEESDAGSNFDAIQRNVKSYLKSSEADSKPGKKMIIEQLRITAARAHYAPSLLQGKEIDLDLPDITLRNIGKKKGGVTAGELASIVADAMKARLTKAIARNAASTLSKPVKETGGLLQGLFN